MKIIMVIPRVEEGVNAEKMLVTGYKLKNSRVIEQYNDYSSLQYIILKISE